MTIDVGWVAPILGGAFLFLLFVVILSVFDVYWKKWWGGHDE